jgi:hypothetical protein
MEYYEPPTFDDYDEIYNRGDILHDVKKMDRGYTKIKSYVERADGTTRKSKMDIYTTGVIGSNIRDAETGEFYPHIVGTADEDFYFKVKISSGECRSKNGSNTLFYMSPVHCMKHLNCELSQEIVNNWEIKRNLCKTNRHK